MLLAARPVAVWAQPAAQALAIENAIWDLNTPLANRLLLADTDTARCAFYRHNLVFMLTLASQAPAQAERFYALSDSVQQYLDDRPESARVLAYRTELHFERAIVKLLQQRNFAAVWDLREAYKLSNKLAQKYPAHNLHAKVLGIFQVAISSLPEQYRWLANLLGYRGELAAGLRNITAACTQAPLLQNEAFAAQYFVLKLGLNEPEQAGAWIDSLYRRGTPPRVLSYLHAISLVDRKRNAEALSELQALVRLNDFSANTAFPYPVYALARSHLYAGRHNEARQYFQSFLSFCRGTILVRDAAFRMGQSFLLMADATQASQAFKLVTDLPDSGFDEDAFATRFAKQYLETPPAPAELALLRARYAFDGGYFAEALAQLRTLDLSRLDPGMETEFRYRTGRIYHEMGKPDSARAAYVQCIHSNPQGKLWMKVHAHYYLGRLAEERQEWQTARAWYRQVLNYQNYDYRLGLEQKTHSALQRIEPKLKAKP